MAYARMTGRRYVNYDRGMRFAPCEVYILGTRMRVEPEPVRVLECCACRLNGRDGWHSSFYTRSRWAMLKHIRRHRRRGHRVPRAVISRLLREIRRVGDEY